MALPVSLLMAILFTFASAQVIADMDDTGPKGKKYIELVSYLDTYDEAYCNGILNAIETNRGLDLKNITDEQIQQLWGAWTLTQDQKDVIFLIANASDRICELMDTMAMPGVNQ
jgi:hypothetical protein